MKTTSENRRSLLLLGAGAIVGIVMAAVGFIDPADRNDLPEGVVAKVNDSYISEEKYLTLLNGLISDKRSEITNEDRAYVLERLIEEELLVQRGKEIGMVDSDRVIRNTLVQTMIASVIADVAGEDVPESKLISFYEKNLDYFALPDRLHIQQIIFRAGNKKKDSKEIGFKKALARAKRAYNELKEGASYITVAGRYGETTAIDIPNSLLPPNKLREYIGPALLEVSMKLKTGEFSKPIKTPGGYRILIMINRAGRKEQNFKSIKKEIETAYRQQKDDIILREYIEQLKESSNILRAQIKDKPIEEF